jgi:hypothetical protein
MPANGEAKKKVQLPKWFCEFEVGVSTVKIIICLHGKKGGGGRSNKSAMGSD